MPEMKRALTQRALQEGFIKRGYGFLRAGKDCDFQDYLSFGASTYSYGRFVAPGIGVHHILVEQLYTKVTKERLKSPLWLINVNIGYLQPARNYAHWFFDDVSQVDMVCDQMFEEIKEYGLPFYSEYEDIARMIHVYETRIIRGYDGLELKWISNTQQFTILPLLYHIVGETDKGIDFMDRVIKNGAYMDNFRQSFYDNYFQLG